MSPIEFTGVNVIYAKDQPEYLPLPVMKLQDGTVISCWQVTDEDLERIIKTRQVFVSQLTFNTPLQPLNVVTGLDELVQFVNG
jgi:hypothetical protein